MTREKIMVGAYVNPSFVRQATALGVTCSNLRGLSKKATFVVENGELYVYNYGKKTKAAK